MDEICVFQTIEKFENKEAKTQRTKSSHINFSPWNTHRATPQYLLRCNICKSKFRLLQRTLGDNSEAAKRYFEHFKSNGALV